MMIEIYLCKKPFMQMAPFMHDELGILQYSLNRSIYSGIVKCFFFLRALSLMGYTLEIQKGKSVISIRPENYALAERKDHNE